MNSEEFRRHAHALVDWMADYLTQNRIRGAFSIRFSIGQTATQRRHVEAAWRTIQETARSLPAGRAGSRT